jgi:hypothetical protein
MGFEPHDLYIDPERTESLGSRSIMKKTNCLDAADLCLSWSNHSRRCAKERLQLAHSVQFFRIGSSGEFLDLEGNNGCCVPVARFALRIASCPTMN